MMFIVAFVKSHAMVCVSFTEVPASLYAMLLSIVSLRPVVYSQVFKYVIRWEVEPDPAWGHC
jgi:hypothetical protein